MENELHIQTLIAEKKVDQAIEPLPVHGMGPTYSIEILRDEIVITFLEDYNKTWGKVTTYIIRSTTTDAAQVYRPKSSVNIESMWVRGWESDIRLLKLEAYRTKETRELLGQKSETSGTAAK